MRRIWQHSSFVMFHLGKDLGGLAASSLASWLFSPASASRGQSRPPARTERCWPRLQAIPLAQRGCCSSSHRTSILANREGQRGRQAAFSFRAQFGSSWPQLSHVVRRGARKSKRCLRRAAPRGRAVDTQRFGHWGRAAAPPISKRTKAVNERRWFKPWERM